MIQAAIMKAKNAALCSLCCCSLSACLWTSPALDSAPAVSRSSFVLSDGTQALEYTLQKQVGTEAREDVKNLLFVIPGSDCISMAPMLPDYFRGLEGESGKTRIYLLQKRHIHRFSRGKYCGDAYTDHDHLQQWLSDQSEFIRAKLALHSRSIASPSRVILLGISEGAETATMLAQTLPVSHLVLLAHSGKAPLQVYQELARENLTMRQAWETLSAALANPDLPGQARIHGRSLRYWREISTMVQTETLVKLSIPVLIAAAGQDPVMPAGTETFLAELNQRSQGRIQVLWFTRADHALHHPQHAYLPDFMFLLEQWLMQGNQAFSSGFLALE